MTWKPGQSGNPKGRTAEKLVADALRLAANEEIEDDGVKKRKLRVAAEKVVQKAIEGDLAAFNIVADRLDGKPHATAEIDHHNHQHIDEMSDDELIGIARTRSANGAGPTNGTTKPDSVH